LQQLSILFSFSIFYLIGSFTPKINIHLMAYKKKQTVRRCLPSKTVIPKVRRTVAKVRQKLSWTNKIILIVGPIDGLTYARKYFIFGKFSDNCQIKIFDHCSHRKFSLSSWKILFLFLKYWYRDFSNCRKGILNPQMKNDWHQHGFVYVRSQS
jgi:hypothetical protein